MLACVRPYPSMKMIMCCEGLTISGAVGAQVTVINTTSITLVDQPMQFQTSSIYKFFVTFLAFVITEKRNKPSVDQHIMLIAHGDIKKLYIISIHHFYSSSFEAHFMKNLTPTR